MANITLADYVGYIFSEITRARDHADRVAKEVALVYAQDEILKNFSVPRFKIPEMELTIPVIISGAKFSTTVSFKMEADAFKNVMNSKMNNAIKTILIKKSNIKNDFTVIKSDIFVKPIFKEIIAPKVLSVSSKKVKGSNIPLKGRLPIEDTVDTLINEFYDQLVNSTDPTHPENIIQVKWAAIFNKKIEEQNLLQDYKAQNPNNELFNQSLVEIAEIIKANTIVSSTKIDNLLVNPETNAVKNESTDASIFTIKAKIMEEGMFIKTIMDQDTQTESKIVEFE
jgi:hypothetical protein